MSTQPFLRSFLWKSNNNNYSHPIHPTISQIRSNQSSIQIKTNQPSWRTKTWASSPALSTSLVDTRSRTKTTSCRWGRKKMWHQKICLSQADDDRMCSDGICCLSFFCFRPNSTGPIASISISQEDLFRKCSNWIHNPWCFWLGDDDGTRTRPDDTWWWWRFWQLIIPFTTYLLNLLEYFQTKTRRCGTTMAAKSFPSTCSTLTCCPKSVKSSEMSWATSSGARPIPLLALLFWVRERCNSYQMLQTWKKQHAASRYIVRYSTEESGQ